MNQIDLWIKSLEQAFEKTGEIAPWPVHIGSVAPYFSDMEARNIFDKLKKISKEKDAHNIARKLLISPGVTKALLMDFIIGMKVAKPKITRVERIWFVNYIFDVLSEMQAGDIFCLDGKNLILSDVEAQNLIKGRPWIWEGKENRELVQSLYKVSASTKSLIWSLYFYGWDDIGYEVHGPYNVRGPRGNVLQLVITDYFDIKPTILWNSMEKFPYNSVRLFSLYKKGIKLSIDIFCHFFNEGNLLDSTEGIYIEANGIPLRIKTQAESITKELLTKVSEQHALINRMTKEEVINKYIESRYYAFRKWREYFGEDWYPPKKVLSRIKEWGIIEIPEGKGPSWSELKKAFDPRTNYIPGA